MIEKDCGRPLTYSGLKESDDDNEKDDVSRYIS